LVNYKESNEVIVFGYAGNMNEITINLDLVEALVNEFQDCIFKFAGEINFINSNNAKRFRKIIDVKNVIYLGKVPYDKIPMEVVAWDVCLMLDDFSEISRYVHHNKIYQYLAMGKSVVITKTHSDYDDLRSDVFESSSINEFIENLKLAMVLSNDDKQVVRRRLLASKNSSAVRADQFMKIICDFYGSEL
jgi:hypothetical protein